MNVPIKLQCGIRRSVRNGSPICLLMRNHIGEHWGYQLSGKPRWWNDKEIS